MHKYLLPLVTIFFVLFLMPFDLFAEPQSTPSPTSLPTSNVSTAISSQKVDIFIFSQYSFVGKGEKALRTDQIFINGILITGLSLNSYIHYETNELKMKVAALGLHISGPFTASVYSEYVINAKPGETYYLMIQKGGRELNLLTKEEADEYLRKFTKQSY